MRLSFILLIIAVTAFFLLDISSEKGMSLLYYGILLGFLSLSFLYMSKKKILKNLKYLLIWIIIFTTGFIIISYKEELTNNQVIANLIPGKAIVTEESLTFFASQDSHFYINTIINGQKVRFLLDTGATDIVLNQQDAIKIGLQPEMLNYNRVYQTANGTTKGATIILTNITIENLSFNNIRASVNQGELGTSLLGMRFLRLFSKYEFEGNKVILYK